MNIDIVSAKDEALLAFFSVQRAFDLTDKHVAVVDIGGGSTEIVLAFGNLVEAIYTTQLGAVRLTETHGNGPTMAGDGYAKLVVSIDRHLRKHTRNPVFVPHLLYGSGGTFTSLASMVMASKGQSNLPIRGYQVTRAEVRHVLDRLRKLPLKDRASVPGLSPDRADIIVAGLAIVDRVMERLEVNMLQVHNRGVRDGLLLTMIDDTLGRTSIDPHDREAAIEQMAMTCGGEIAHGRHVAQLAGSIFMQLASQFRLDVADRPLLEAAARLQDVGYLINYDQHHKHSYHLILNSRLQGFQPQELELIANVARYHRGAEPKKRHKNFRQLSPRDRQRVRQLGSILRLAGGLDRSNSQQVCAVDVRITDHRAELLLVSERIPEVDLWGARRRGEFFERVFGVKLRVHWAGTQSASPQHAVSPETTGAAERSDGGNGAPIPGVTLARPHSQ